MQTGACPGMDLFLQPTGILSVMLVDATFQNMKTEFYFRIWDLNRGADAQH
jgi:hypothetical protein